MSNAQYFKRLRDLFILYEGVKTQEDKDHYSFLIDKEIEIIKIDAKIEETNSNFTKLLQKSA